MPKMFKKTVKKNQPKVTNIKNKKKSGLYFFANAENYDEVSSLKYWLVLVIFLLLAGLILSNFYWKTGSQIFSCHQAPAGVSDELKPMRNEANNMSLANPASMNCLEQNANVEMRKNASGSEYGVCVFPSGFECEEWAMLRGECPVGGVDVSGYRNALDYYCAINGGTVLGDNCKLSEDITCNSEDYYLGRCHR